MNRTDKIVVAIHISSIVLLILFFLWGWCCEAYNHHDFGLLDAGSLPLYIVLYLGYVNPIVYLLSLIYLIVAAVKPFFKKVKDKNKNKTNSEN